MNKIFYIGILTFGIGILLSTLTGFFIKDSMMWFYSWTLTGCGLALICLCYLDGGSTKV